MKITYIVLALGLMTLKASAQLAATETVFDTVAGANTYHYTVTLTDTGTTTIGAFWFSWIPGQSYMQNDFSNIVSPAGWSSNIQVHPGTGELGGSIEWGATTPLTTGNSVSFGFDSAETPTQLAGNSPYFSNPPETTATVYSGGVLASPSITITGAVVPEPATWAMFLSGILLLPVVRHFRRSRLTVR